MRGQIPPGKLIVSAVLAPVIRDRCGAMDWLGRLFNAVTHAHQEEPMELRNPAIHSFPLVFSAANMTLRSIIFHWKYRIQ